MCAVEIYYHILHKNMGSNSANRLYWVRFARREIEWHKRNCPDCLDRAPRSNYNLSRPRRVTYRQSERES